MSIPNFENIDKWLFEFTEGNLTAEQETHLFDFLEQHPELMPEFKAWTGAKVKAPIQQADFSSQHLIKHTPFLLRPFSLVSIGFLALTLSWFGYNSIPKAPLYTKAEIDTEIIDTETEQTDVYIDQLLALSQKKIQESTVETKNVSSKSNLKSISEVKRISLDQKPPFGWSRSVTGIIETTSSEETTNSKDKTNAIQEIELSELISENDFDIENEIAFNDIQNITKSSEFDVIVGYIREKENFNNADDNTESTANSEDYALNRANKAAKSSASKSTLKKSISTTLRKIKRMADYPVALRNTKNPNFHVPMLTGYNANIAMVGTAPGNRIQATSRMQWINEANSQSMNSLSWDGYIYALRGGIGVDVNYNNYQNSDLSNYSAGLTYSPKFSINKKVSFEPAIRFKMGVVNLDQQASSIGNSIELDRRNIVSLFGDEQKASGSQLWYRDLGVGFMLNTEWFYAGFNADNLGQHYNNFYSSDLNKEYKSNIHYTAVMGTEYASNTREMRISGYALFQNYGNLNELWLGTNFQYNWMQIGAGASTNADLAASIGALFKQYSIHYNIDYTESRLLNKQNLSHQVSMRFLMKPKRNVAKFLKL